MKAWFLPVVGALLLAAIAPAGGSPFASPADSVAFRREAPFTRRPLRLDIPAGWIGNGIAYGPHRDGESPTGAQPTRAELREDLHLMAAHWKLIRTYGSTGPARTILDVIREDHLDTKVMLGIWIDPEARRDSTGAVVEEFPASRAANRREIEAGVALAGEYPDEVIALGVGNETQVFWSSHRVAPARLIEAIREVRARTTVPVTTVDDYNFWNKPESDAVASETDFIAVNAHPLWNGIQLEDALDWTRKTLAEVQADHPGMPVILAETGWATERDTVGEQATLMKGAVGEDEQATFFKEVTAWAAAEKVPTFFFEAFDENWKGGDRPADVEKHWGLFRADRTPKKAMAGGKRAR
jgi:exo-beta-1,3-glucanase (GH17 family)